MDQSELNERIKQHGMWLRDSTNGNRFVLKEGDHLIGANMQGANMQGAYMRGAYMRDANMQGAYMRGANMQGANMRDANMQGADMQGANMQGANMRDANLAEAILFKDGIHSTTINQIIGLYYHVYLLDDHIKIGCELHTVQEWREFNDDVIGNMDSNALKFWIKHKKFILSYYE